MEKVIQLLKSFNFTESESKVYISLLKNGAGTGYEISKNSAVPRSKVYNILEILMEKGCIVVSKQTNPVHYSAVPIEEFIENIKSNVNDSLTEVKKELKSYNQTMDLENFWYIRGYKNIFNKCKLLLSEAKSEVYVQVWKEDINHIIEELRAVEERLERSVIILYSTNHDYQVPLTNYYKHGFEEEKLQESGGRWINIVVDSKEILFGHIQNDKNAEVIWTQSTPMVFLAKENIIHDAYCLRLIDAMGKDAKKQFGNELKGIRSIFNQKNVKKDKQNDSCDDYTDPGGPD
ncbi:helix-turn-helix domain-containing protein [Paenibacillus sp. D2_2]|uniref:TrmB family transcriptional regulator n=1 Tax=Paenibacillus sp. D2_2 TaxID=3073092 RepID=UPI002814FFFE|nr:helix-turn-helix domain-containing protein [Paenibacillus sp. D2_2]WMT40942.1 helix-turn-helix domain-containing protein [Paenibacillus sp. D2_2]